MNCQQVQESLGDHSVGLLDAARISAFEQHVKICAECAKSVHEFHRCMELLDHMPAPSPPTDLWMGVRARLELERSVAQYAQSSSLPTPAATASRATMATAPFASWWSGAVAAVSGFAAASAVLVLLSSQPSGGPSTVATVPPMAVSVSQHSIMDSNSPVADGASVVAADAVSMRPIQGRVQYPRVIVPGRELLGEPYYSGDLGAVLSTPMGLPQGEPTGSAGEDRRR